MTKLNPNQQEAVNFEFESLLVVAGAGTGKTFNTEGIERLDEKNPHRYYGSKV